MLRPIHRFWMYTFLFFRFFQRCVPTDEKIFWVLEGKRERMLPVLSPKLSSRKSDNDELLTSSSLLSSSSGSSNMLSSSYVDRVKSAASSSLEATARRRGGDDNEIPNRLLGTSQTSRLLESSSSDNMSSFRSVDRVKSATPSRLEIGAKSNRRMMRSPPKRSPKFLKPIAPKQIKDTVIAKEIVLGDAVSEFLIANSDGSGVLTFEQFRKWYVTRCKPKSSSRSSSNPRVKNELNSLSKKTEGEEEDVEVEKPQEQPPETSVSPLTISSPRSVRTIDDLKAPSPFAQEAQRVIEEETAKTDAFAWLIGGDDDDDDDDNDVEEKQGGQEEVEEKQEDQQEEEQQDEIEEPPQQESIDRTTTTSTPTTTKKITAIDNKPRTASHEAFDWLMSPVDENTSMPKQEASTLKARSIIEEEEGNRVMEEEGVVL